MAFRPLTFVVADGLRALGLPASAISIRFAVRKQRGVPHGQKHSVPLRVEVAHRTPEGLPLCPPLSDESPEEGLPSEDAQVVARASQRTCICLFAPIERGCRSHLARLDFSRYTRRRSDVFATSCLAYLRGRSHDRPAKPTSSSACTLSNAPHLDRCRSTGLRRNRPSRQPWPKPRPCGWSCGSCHRCRSNEAFPACVSRSLAPKRGSRSKHSTLPRTATETVSETEPVLSSRRRQKPQLRTRHRPRAPSPPEL